MILYLQNLTNQLTSSFDNHNKNIEQKIGAFVSHYDLVVASALLLLQLIKGCLNLQTEASISSLLFEIFKVSLSSPNCTSHSRCVFKEDGIFCEQTRGASFVCHGDELIWKIGGKKAARLKSRKLQDEQNYVFNRLAIARNRRDALAKVTFRDRLMPLNGFLPQIKMDKHSAHIKHYWTSTIC